MSKGGLRVIRTIPGAARLAPLMREFEAGGGVATAFSDSSLRVLESLLSEEGAVEVMPFGQVVRSVLALTEGPSMMLAQRGLILGAIEEACRVLPEESPFFRVGRFGGFHRRLAQTLDELRARGIGAAELEGAADRCEEALALKLRQMAAIEIEIRQTLDALGRRMPTDDLRECLEAPALEARPGRLFVLIGSADEPLKADWLKWLARAGWEVTAILDRAASGQHLFEDADKMAARLSMTAEEQGEASRLARCLFGNDVPCEDAPDVLVLSAADPLAEVEWVLRECRREMLEGRSAGAIGICARSLEDYAGLLEAAASRFQIPLRITRRVPLITNGFARLVLETLECCSGDDVRALGPIARQSYAGVSRKLHMELSGALREAFSHRDEQWQSLSEWSSQRRQEIPWLAELLEWRQECLAEPVNLALWKARLDDLVHRLDWLTSSMEGPLQLRSRDTRARNAFQRALAQRGSVHQLREARQLTLRQFAAECRRIWSEEEVTVPSAEYGIQVVASAECLGQVESLYVLGMLEGSFPRRRSEDPILTDSDRAQLNATLPAEQRLGDSHLRARQERDEFYRVCVAPGRRLTLSFPATDEDRDNIPAFYLSEVERWCPVEKVHRPRQRLFDDSETAPDADRRLAQGASAGGKVGVDNSLNSVEANLAVRASAEGPFSPQELRDVLECPFRYMARYRLSLRTGRARSRWAALRYLPQKVQLAKAKTEQEARRALETALDAEIEMHFPEASRFELSLMQAGGRRLIEEWVQREFEARKIWPKDPASLRTGVAFGDSGLASELPMKGAKVVLTGQVDAASRMGPYNVLSMTERIRPRPDDAQREELSEADRFEYGLHLWSMFEKGRDAGLEIDGMHGERTLYLMPRNPSFNLPSRQEAGLRVVDLGEARQFLPEIRRLLEKAVNRVGRPAVHDEAAEYCRWCDFGELCRSSLDFGEQSDPFEEEHAPQEA